VVTASYHLNFFRLIVTYIVNIVVFRSSLGGCLTFKSLLVLNGFLLHTFPCIYIAGRVFSILLNSRVNLVEFPLPESTCHASRSKSKHSRNRFSQNHISVLLFSLLLVLQQTKRFCPRNIWLRHAHILFVLHFHSVSLGKEFESFFLLEPSHFPPIQFLLYCSSLLFLS
jgi:hypothetical protein